MLTTLDSPVLERKPDTTSSNLSCPTSMQSVCLMVLTRIFLSAPFATASSGTRGLHKVADAKQERLGEPAGQALGQPRQAERIPCISDHVIERGPGVSDHAVVKPIPIETAGGTRTLHQEGVEFLGGTQLDDSGQIGR